MLTISSNSQILVEERQMNVICTVFTTKQEGEKISVEIPKNTKHETSPSQCHLLLIVTACPLLN
jgi:hypothetical protein